MVTISPSILNSDAANLGGELQRIRSADYAHVDVMDNHFVPNLTWGLPIVEALVKREILPLDAHLMIENPERWAPQYAEAGCESVTFHIEAAEKPRAIIDDLHAAGVKACIAVKPGTDLQEIESYLPYLEMVLIMTVEPGFGGQRFIPEMLPKISRLRRLVSESNLDLAIQVDGGVNANTIIQAAEAGANVFVAGSAVFRSRNPELEVQNLRELAIEACSHP